MRCLRFFTLSATVLLLGVSATSANESNTDQLIVHEWGTFTELHDDKGFSIGGINTDDEPVPDFVHRISEYVVQSTNEPWRPASPRKGKAVQWNSRVTTRLETPVIYFYLPGGQKDPMTVDVDVQLRGGWLSEYFPNAAVEAPGLKKNKLEQDAIGSLQWKGLQIGAKGPIPKTDDHVWLAPRGPNSAPVLTPSGEAEEYLFYRGVGSFSGPLRVRTDLSQNQIQLVSQMQAFGDDLELTIPAAWLVHVQANGDVAYRALDAMQASTGHAQIIANVDRSFKSSEFSSGNLDQLRTEMHEALVDDGLFPDEATAMLATWNRAYFQSAGLRLFYILPTEWTDDRMPLTVSVPSTVDRVMMGRIELITDNHRDQLALLSNQPPSSNEWLKKIPESPARKRFYKGDNDAASELGVEIPRDYAAYLKLGRFRNALIYHELLRTKNTNLFNFAKINRLLTSEMQKQLHEQQVAGSQVASTSAD